MTTPSSPSAPKQIHPERKRRVKQALTFFSITAWITGIMLLLLVVRMVMQYLLHMDVSMLGWVAIVHGWCYLAFFIAALNLGLKARWSMPQWIVTVIAGVVPLLSFFVEKWRRDEVTEKFQLNAA
ncbi:DUF3817 domain-containing protein [Corynebacterium breve]|uniref:DUF3817 domain-containing protein n=1 Tax=Corynebacterium breve TaxID=3049799 RepID=A0ABY8VC47_9CORY|nr:DUF3817 domain-containing protein [Corynebacterium breve]WIM67245.1 DUF3817 domain-containing protein [Corynebacterium breve]